MLAALVVVLLVQAFLVKIYRVPSASMEQTLQATVGGGDRMLVDRTAYVSAGPSRGDVIVFSRPDSWASKTSTPSSGGLRGAARAFSDKTGLGASNEQFLVKRVVAVEGETTSCCSAEGKLVVNGEPVDEPYIFENLPYRLGVLDCDTDPRSLRCIPEYTVPKGELLVVGDHRSQSSDSVVLCRSPVASSARAEDCIRTVHSSRVVGRAFFIVWPLSRVGTIG